jgi:hypothetical protein
MKAVTLLRFVACAETWVHSYSPETKIVIRGIPEVFKAVVSAGKKMARVSWHIHGIIHVVFTPRGAMVTAVTYRTTVQHLQEETGRRRTHLLYPRRAITAR